MIAYGTKEEKLIIKSSNFLSKEFINSRIIPLKNYHHGELTLSHPDRFCQIDSALAFRLNRNVRDMIFVLKQFADLTVNWFNFA